MKAAETLVDALSGLTQNSKKACLARSLQRGDNQRMGNFVQLTNMLASERKILIAGHSHAYALGLPGAKVDAEPELVTIEPGFDGLIGPWPRGDLYWDVLTAQAKEGGYAVALSYLGNEHLANFLIEVEPFDFINSADPDADLQDDAAVVPESMVRAMFGAHGSKLHAILRKLSDAGVPTLVVATPPPKEGLAQLLETEPFFVKRLEGLGLSADTATLCPAPVLLKLWRLLQTMLAEAAAEYGATYVPYPARLLTEDGYLKREYARDDVTHANAAAGAALRAELTALVKEFR